MLWMTCLKRLPEGWLLTPHAGELAALLGISRPEVVDDPIGKAYGSPPHAGMTTVLLKGATQYMAPIRSEPSPWRSPGPAWTAQAGSGDVLAGICGTLLAAGLPALAKAAAIGGVGSGHGSPRPASPARSRPMLSRRRFPRCWCTLPNWADQPVLAGDLTPRSIAAQ